MPAASMPGVFEGPHLLLADDDVTGQKRGERLTVVLGRAAATGPRDEAAQSTFESRAAAKREPADLDEIEQALDEALELGVRDAGAQSRRHLEAELFELTHALLLADAFFHGSR